VGVNVKTELTKYPIMHPQKMNTSIILDMVAKNILLAILRYIFSGSIYHNLHVVGKDLIDYSLVDSLHLAFSDIPHYG
jgi:hypothetical protein